MYCFPPSRASLTVELVIVPGPDRVAVGCLGRGTLHERPGELIAHVLEEIEAVPGFLQ